MRHRAARLVLVAAIAASTAMAGAAVPHLGVRAAVRHAARVAVVPVNTNAATALSHASRATAGAAAVAMDALRAPAAAVVLAIVMWLRRRRVARPRVAAARWCSGCRAPPAGRL